LKVKKLQDKILTSSILKSKIDKDNFGKINKQKKEGKLEKKWKKKMKKKTKKKKEEEEECTMDYYCNLQCIGCGWTVNSPHPLAYYLIYISFHPCLFLLY